MSYGQGSRPTTAKPGSAEGRKGWQPRETLSYDTLGRDRFEPLRSPPRAWVWVEGERWISLPKSKKGMWVRIVACYLADIVGSKGRERPCPTQMRKETHLSGMESYQWTHWRQPEAIEAPRDASEVYARLRHGATGTLG